MPHDQPVIAVEAADGHRYELIHLRPAEATASLLFLPGMGLSARQYIPFAQSLGERGIEVFIHEWRGLGSSSLRAGRDVNWGYRELLEFDLAAALDQTLRHAHDTRLMLGGHSLGSQFGALLAATRYPDCAGLVVVAGGAPYWRCFRGSRAVLLRSVFTMLPLIARAVGHFPGRQLGFAGREARNVMIDWAETGRRGSYNLDSIAADLEAAMAALNTPKLGLRLQDDWFVTPASLDHLLDKIGGERVDCIISSEQLGGPADHFSWMQTPVAVAEAIAAWHRDQSADAISRA